MDGITHTRKINYKIWVEDVSKFGTILFFIVLANHMSLEYLDNMKIWPVLVLCQIVYATLYFVRIFEHKEPKYWTYIEVK